jgi:hypothetical protein
VKAEARNEWSYTSTLLYVFMAWSLIKWFGCLFNDALSISRYGPMASNGRTDELQRIWKEAVVA